MYRLLIVLLFLVLTYSFAGTFLNDLQLKDSTPTEAPTTGYGRFHVEGSDPYYTDDTNTSYNLLLGGNAVIDDLLDVVLTGATTGDALVFDGANWVNGPVASSLDSLSDVVLTGSTTGQALVFDGSNWVNGNVASTLSSLTDTNITGAANNDFLVFDGLDWINRGATTGDITTATIGTPTYNNLEDMINQVISAGVITDGMCTDNGDGTIAVAQLEGFIKDADTAYADIYRITIPASASVTLTDNSENYVYVDYNSGTPILAVATSGSAIRDNERTQFEVCEIHKEGTDLHITPHAQLSGEVMRRSQQRNYDIEKIRRVSGMILGETGTRNITVTAGKYWVKLNPMTTAAIDTSAADTFTRYYRDGSGGWTKELTQTQWNNTQYDDNSGTLQTMTVNRYACSYWWLESDGDLIMLYPQAQYISLAAAEAATIPTAPDRVAEHGIFIARTCYQESDTTFLSIANPFDTQLSFASASDHGNLSGLTDDDHTQYLLANSGRNSTGTQIFEDNVHIYDFLYLDKKTDKYNMFIFPEGTTTAGITSANKNVFIGGENENSAITSASNNTSVGNESWGKISSGSWNSMYGSQAGMALTTGQYNSGFGFSTLTSLANGTQNAGFGSQALYQVSSASYNACIGFQCLYTGNVANRVALGYSAGKYANEADAFVIDNRDRTNNATEKTNALMYGYIKATPDLNVLNINATTTVNGVFEANDEFVFDEKTFTSVATGTTDNGILTTKGYVDTSINNIPVATYGTNGLLSSTKYGEFDTANTDKYGFRNAEDNSLSSWDLTGLTNATFVINPTTPLFGTYDYKMGNVTGSASEAATTTNVAIPVGSAGRSHGVTFNYSYDGADNDIRVEFVDVTNTATIDYVLLEAGTNKKAQLMGFTQSTTANVKVRFIINTVNNGKFLYIDNLKFEVDPQKTVELIATQYLSHSAGSATLTNGTDEFEFNVSNITSYGDSVLTVTDDSANTRTKFVNNTANDVVVTVSMGGGTMNDNNEQLMVFINGATVQESTMMSSGTANKAISSSFILAPTQYFSIGQNGTIASSSQVRVNITAIGTKEGVVHSDTYPENVFSAQIDASAAVTDQSPNSFISSCTDADPRVCTLTTSFFGADPVCWANPITSGNTAVVTADTSTSVTIDTTDANTAFTLFCKRSSTDYKPLTGTVITPVTQTCYVQEVRAANTNGGDAAATTNNVRRLNTTTGDCSFLSIGNGTLGTDGTANRVTLSAGKYEITADAPAVAVNANKIKLYNTGTTAYDIVGATTYSNAAAYYTTSLASLYGTLTLSSPATYELHHYTVAAKSGDGLGLPANNGVEIYAQIKITRLK